MAGEFGLSLSRPAWENAGEIRTGEQRHGVGGGDVVLSSAMKNSPGSSSFRLLSDDSVLTTEDAQSSHEFGAANTLLLVLLLMMCILAGYLLRERNFQYLPESGAAMLLGIIAGGFLRLLFPDESELDLIQFNSQVFFFVLLPPIIFEAGYTLKKKRFFSNITSILLYAIVGTFVSAFSVGFLTYGAAKAGMIHIEKENPLQALLFGSLISSVDPVATLAIIGSSDMNCDPTLYSLVFGESVLNDAVAIVLFHVFNQYTGAKSFQATDIFKVVVQFCGIFFASVAIGISCGLLCSFVFKTSNLSAHHTYEIQLLFLFSFGCFAFAELVSMSGVVALFFCSVTLAHYNFYNLSEQSKISSTYVFEAMAKTSESVVFAYMGISLFTAGSTWDPGFLFLGTIFCLIGRALNIFPLSWVANLGRREKISTKMQFVIFYAGLRGAVAYALSTQLAKETGSTKGIEVIQTTTLGIIIFSTFILGGTTSPILQRLGMKQDGSRARSPSNQLREDFSRYAGVPLNEPFTQDADSPTTTRDRSLSSYQTEDRSIKAIWTRIDDRFMKPLFGGQDPFARLTTAQESELEMDPEFSLPRHLNHVSSSSTSSDSTVDSEP